GPGGRGWPARPPAGELELVGLPEEVVPEASMRRLVGERETRRQIETPRGDEWVVRPQHDAFVSGVTGELDARFHQSCPDTESATVRMDEQNPQLCSGVALRDTEDAAHTPAFELGDPGRLAPGIVAGRIVGDDLRHQRLEAAVPAELLRVHLTVCHDHPPEIARSTEQTESGGDRRRLHRRAATP